MHPDQNDKLEAAAATSWGRVAVLPTGQGWESGLGEDGYWVSGWQFFLLVKQVFQVYMLLYFFSLVWPLSLGQKMCTSGALLFSSQLGGRKKLLMAELSGYNLISWVWG